MKVKRFSAFVLLTAVAGAILSGSVEGAIIMNQIGTASAYDFASSPSPTPSQVFRDFPDFDSAVLENFTASTTELRLSKVSALFRAQGGFAAFQAVEGYSLNFYSNVTLATTSLAGDVASLMVTVGSGASVIQVVDGTAANEYGLVSLNIDLSLPTAGTYWVGVSPISDYTITGQLLLMSNGATGPITPGDGNAHLANPGLGFGTGALSDLNADYAYSVEAVPEPTALTLCILGSCAWLYRRQRAR